MLFLLAFLYQINDYELEGKSQIELEYSVKNACEVYITFSKGYEIYKITTKIEGEGSKILNLNSAKLIPTRRKPFKIPLTIEGNCDGRILNVNFK
ncbi:MAG: hypothetical protein ACO2O6_04910 [Candidatus Hydrothermia bacterium]|jgi:hypothetical protein|nr:hypothetical protein [Candidatus Hydrothermia bacterium]